MFGRTTKPLGISGTSRKATSPSVIAAGMHVLGNIVSDGALDIDGQIDGNVRAVTISIRENGKIRGDVVADVLHIYGEVHGLVKAQTVLLSSSARVIGTIMHESLTVEDGAHIDGKFKRMEKLFTEGEPQPIRQLTGPAPVDEGFDNDNEEPASEAEIKILENLRLIR